MKRAMKINKRTCLSTAVALTIATACVSQRREQLDQWQQGNGTFEVRVTELNESTQWGPSQFCYHFETAVTNKSAWNEITTVCTDDDIEIPKGQVRFVNERIGYLFMVRKYAVTTDGGNSWQVWDVDQGAPDRQYRNERFIKEVKISADGSGTTWESFQRQLQTARPRCLASRLWSE